MTPIQGARRNMFTLPCYQLMVLTDNKSSVIIQTSYLSTFDVNLFNFFPFACRQVIKNCIKQIFFEEAKLITFPHEAKKKPAESKLHQL